MSDFQKHEHLLKRIKVASKCVVILTPLFYTYVKKIHFKNNIQNKIKPKNLCKKNRLIHNQLILSEILKYWQKYTSILQRHNHLLDNFLFFSDLNFIRLKEEWKFI